MYRAALSEKAGRVRLYLSESNSGDNRIFPSGRRPFRRVRALTLDSWFERTGQPVNFSGDPMDLPRFLEERGFTLLHPDEARRRLVPADLGAILAWCPPDREDAYTNLLALREIVPPQRPF